MLKKDMSVESLQARLGELACEFRSLGAFPYGDCRILLKTMASSEEDKDNLIPALDIYFADIYGISDHSLNRLKRLPLTRMEQFERILSRTFAEQWPNLVSFLQSANLETTPALQKRLIMADEMRVIALQIIRILLVDSKTNLSHLQGNQN